MKKIASILDYSYPYLDPAVWGEDMKLHVYQKDFIMRLLDSMYENYKLKQPEAWITDVQIIGSLTTSKWLFSSDLDVHMCVNLAKFIEFNMPGVDPKVAFDFLDNTRKEFDRAKILAPMTEHPIEFYFEVPDFVATNTSMVGIYSINQDKWLKEPVLFDADVDFEESKAQVMAEAEALAQQLDGSFGKIDRQIDRIQELERIITAWGPENQQLFYNKIEQKLKDIETEILRDLELRQQLVDERHAAQDPMADIEMKFKWLQRFGFFGILNNLKVLLRETGGQITLEELPLVKKIVTDSSLREAFLKEALSKHEKIIFVDFDDTIAKEGPDHQMGELMPGAKETIKKLRDKGFKIIIDSVRANEEKGKKDIEEYLKKHDVEVDGFYEGEKPLAFRYIDDRAIEFNGTWDGILEKVEKARKHASLRVAKLNQKYWIAPDGNEFKVTDVLGHYNWIPQNYSILQKYGINVEDTDVVTLAENMLAQGWTRVTTESDYDFDLEVYDLKHLPAYLDNFIAKYFTGMGMIIDDIVHQDNVKITDPFPSIQKVVNKALRQSVANLFSKRDIVAQTKKVKQGDYSCVMALVPHDLAQEIVEWGVRNVPDEELYLTDEGKLGRELESHVTIYYGLLTNDAKAVRRSFNEDKPYKAKLGKVRHFQPPELPFDVLTVEVISEDLDRVNKRTSESFECADDLPSNEYKPHITIAYMKRDKAKDYIGYDGFEGKEVELDTLVFSPHKGNKTYFNISHDKESNFLFEKINKLADFLPSLFNAPDNRWQFEHGGDDKEIGVDPDPISDETTWYAPCTEGKPRTKEVWRQFISMFTKPFSKTQGVELQSYDKELEQKEKHELGEDQTLLEYMKDMPDPTKKDFPHNTTWDPIYQDGEPSKPGMPVTYSPQISNDDNLDQNSPGGFPRRFMGKPKGQWDSNQGEVDKALIDMLKRRNAALNTLTRDITAITKQYALYVNNVAYPAARTLTRWKAERILREKFPQALANGNYKIVEEEFKTSSLNTEAYLQHAYWIDPNGKVIQVRDDKNVNSTHFDWIDENLDMLHDVYGIDIDTSRNYVPQLIERGWVRIGDGADPDLWQVQLADLHAIPKTVDDVLAQFLPAGAKVEFTDSNNLFTEVEYPFNNAQSAVLRALRQPIAASLNKNAGEQSASVPDYLMDEWKTDQINDDTDEEPYRTHDQRDYPYGFHDSPENTDSGIGWPKDNQPYVVRLDILENPAYRLDPFGIGEYNVTWYESLPASDGIEKTNPE